MGYAISWLAVKDVDSERLLKNLELSPTGETLHRRLHIKKQSHAGNSGD
jgi:hypothetical protein